jgi:carbon-monoxide dehydrogenase large subunit
MSNKGMGSSVLRKEDFRFITGRGQYTDDISQPNQLYAYFLRSPVAHANLTSVNTEQAINSKGVIAVYTGKDIDASLPCGWEAPTKPGTPPMHEPPWPILAKEKIRFVGELIAVVIAESVNQAKDACELIDIEYDDLPAVVSPKKAIQGDSPNIWKEIPNNICFEWELGNKEETEKAFSRAKHHVKIDLKNNRLVPNAMEPRSYIGNYEEGKEEYTLHTTTQLPHIIRMLVCTVLGLEEHKVRVISLDVGGGFGSKAFHYAEEAIVTWVAGKLARPIKWTSERSEAFISDRHGRDHITEAELALDDDGNFLAMRVNTLAALGGYLSGSGPAIPTFFYGPLIPGPYKTPNIYCDVKGVFTNTVPVDAYRGAGRPEATYVTERLVEAAAIQTGINSIELRRKNFIQPDQFPYPSPGNLTYDSGDYDATLTSALSAINYDEFETRKNKSKEDGKLRGLGISCYIEACGVAPSKMTLEAGGRGGYYESSTVRVNPTGSVTVFTGSHSHGQGHETVFSQIVHDTLGIPFESIDIVHGDTGRVPYGVGTVGSRSLAVGGPALMRSLDKIIIKGKKIAAHILEAKEDEINFENGEFSIKGTNKFISIAEVIGAAYVPGNYPLDVLEPGLEETSFYDPPNMTYPAGAHICEIEIDPETGKTDIVNYAVSDDFGIIMNPMIVEGQVHGGVAQGIGQAMLEHCIYEEDTAQLINGSFMDYAMPRADNIPSMIVKTEVTESAHGLGVKGCGEAGAIAAPPAVLHAVLDALRPLGVSNFDMPATPNKIWDAIQKAKKI